MEWKQESQLFLYHFYNSLYSCLFFFLSGLHFFHLLLGLLLLSLLFWSCSFYCSCKPKTHSAAPIIDLETNLEEEEVHPPHNNNPRQLELTFIFSWDYRKVEDIFHNYKNLVEDLFIILVVPLLVMVGQRLWHNIGSYCLLPTLDLSYASWRCLHHLSLGK